VEEVRHKERVQAQFAAAAEEYVVSATHAAGDDLAHLVSWAEGGADRVALDVATGGGHTALALAPHYGRVVASDLTDRMLATAEAFIRGRGVGNVEFRRADAENLPFADDTFDTVSCRIAPHHFADVARFVSEVARVLKPGGIFLLEDSVIPEDSALGEFLNHAEKLRDSTHVRSLRIGEWRQMLADAGLDIEAERLFPKAHPFANWLDRARTPAEARLALAAMFRDAPSPTREAFAIVVDPDGRVISYTDEKLALKARKKA
jgi:ubiquinone/menaquinone biosynthesis C-methylase UbiE